MAITINSIRRRRIVTTMVAAHPIRREALEVHRGHGPSKRASLERALVHDRFDRRRRESPSVVKAITCQATNTPSASQPAKGRDSDRVRSRVNRPTIRGRAKSKSLVPFIICRSNLYQEIVSSLSIINPSTIGVLVKPPLSVVCLNPSNDNMFPITQTPSQGSPHLRQRVRTVARLRPIAQLTSQTPAPTIATSSQRIRIGQRE